MDLSEDRLLLELDIGREGERERERVLQAYQTPGKLLRISYRETEWQSPAN
jgi:hypothetical protein